MIKYAILGSGPASLYLCARILKHTSATIDILCTSSVPYGLIRYGVAPDHIAIKNVEYKLEPILNHERVSYTPCYDFPRGWKEPYERIFAATGGSVRRTHDAAITGTQFARWYNGELESNPLLAHCNSSELKIIGNGNVALDCIRLLSKPVMELRGIGMSESVLEQLNDMKFQDILTTRKGIDQLSCTVKEFKALMPYVNLNIDQIEEPINSENNRSRAQIKMINVMKEKVGHTRDSKKPTLHIGHQDRFVSDAILECIGHDVGNDFEDISERVGWARRIGDLSSCIHDLKYISYSLNCISRHSRLSWC